MVVTVIVTGTPKGSKQTDMEITWDKLFQIGFKEVKINIQERYPLEEDGSGASRRVAFRQISEQLPFAVKVLELEIDSSKFEHIKDQICPMFYYDISKHKSSEVKYLGKVSPKNTEFKNILREEFHMNNPKQFVEEFNKEMTYTGQWNSDLTENLQFFFYDPRKDIEEFKRDFIRFIEEPIIAVLANDFKTQPDYYQDYKLESEPILSEKELLKKFQITEIVDSISNYQDHMSKIQLIPLVNEHVKRVMRRAKKLYIFGVYVYDFFIVAEHYSTMALESAIKHRYFEHFPKTVQIKNKHNSATIFNADYSSIMEFCDYHDEWNYHNVQVNDELFLHKSNDLLEWLLKNKIITIWDKKKCSYHIKKRNYLSHPTYAPTHLPNDAYRSIEESTFLINKMFSSLKDK